MPDIDHADHAGIVTSHRRRLLIGLVLGSCTAAWAGAALLAIRSL